MRGETKTPGSAGASPFRIAMRWVLTMFIASFVIAAGCKRDAAPAVTRYTNDFENATPGEPPPNVTAFGPVAVGEAGGNHFLELAGAPVNSFGALFGPGEFQAGEVRARAWGATTGRRLPEFGIGACGASGYKLIVAPGRRQIEIWDNEDPVARVPFEWTPETWTWLRLRVSRDGSGWLLQGKAWREGTPEPVGWSISAREPRQLLPGRASVWGMAFSEKPIRFDDLSVVPDVGG